MVSASSNIYVSATTGHEPAAARDEHGYRRSQTAWLISVEPHNHVIPFMPKHKVERTHFTGKKSDTDAGAYTLTTSAQTDAIVGTVLVADAAHCTAKDVGKALEAGLRAAATDSTQGDEHVAADGDHDDWLRKALHVLQDHKLTDVFDVDEFLAFAHGYVASRADGEAPAMIAYPGLHKDHKKKSQSGSFWMSRPMETSTRKADAESQLYGGLM
ncbi:hypothetical protein LTR08_006183 [Meristemomyces frigidus]|nr:hypothetical protein LTR08_006183 [Meristemomyces frigidus]